MIPFVCDSPDRIAARLFRALRSECPCCTFYRGVLVGAALLPIAFAVGFLLGSHY